MYRYLMALIVCVLCEGAQAQNLVPNGSFEDHSSCPPYFGFSFLATGWGGPGGIGYNSPDYFHECDLTNVVGVPSSEFGYQFAADGQAYMGMITSSLGGQPYYREFIGAQLTQPLAVGVPVCLSFKMAVGGFGTASGISAKYTCKNFGLKFFVNPPDDWQAYLYPNSAALHVDIVPLDTSAWYYYSDVYIPDSAYAFIVLGNFFADSLSDVTILDSSSTSTNPSYAFVDDVRASFDLSYCSQSSMENHSLQSIHAFPIPCGDELTIALPQGLTGALKFRVLDDDSRVLREGLVRPGAGTIPFSDLASGAYVLQIVDDSGLQSTTKVIHIAE